MAMIAPETIERNEKRQRDMVNLVAWQVSRKELW